MHIRKATQIGLAILLLVSLIGLYWAMFIGVTIRFTNEDIQKTLDARLPKTVHGITIEKMVTDLNQQLSATATISAKRWGQDIQAVFFAKGIPRYSPMDGSIRFEPEEVRVESFQFNTSTIGEKISEANERYITNKGLQMLVKDLTPQIERYLEGAAERAMVQALSVMPAYKLPDTTSGYIARSVLSDVRLENNNLVITFTLMRLMWWMAIVVCTALIAVALLIALIRYPSWGTTTILFFD